MYNIFSMKTTQNTWIFGLIALVTTMFVALYVDLKNRDIIILQLETKVDSLENRIEEYNEAVETLGDELHWKEDEISYWGQRYDSTNTELQKYKKP